MPTPGTSGRLTLCVSAPAGSLSLRSLALPAYVRPEECTGSRAISYLTKLLSKGLSLTGMSMGLNTTGFTLCYELLTSSLSIRSIAISLLLCSLSEDAAH